MNVQITIIGLGQIGGSIGLALGSHKDLVTRWGNDLDLGVARRAEKLGAIDRVEINLPNSVRSADIVVLALPLDQIHETLSVIAPDLKEGAVVMDTAPIKEAVVGWAKELLPPNRHYIGLTPVLNPAYLDVRESGLESARADLFQNGMMIIVTPMGIASDAIKLAADFTRLLGATHIFADPVEVDSQIGATHILPQLLGAALLSITVDQPGWREGRKFAGRAFTQVSGAVEFDPPAALANAALLNHQNVTRSIDSLIAALQGLRSDIQTQDQVALTETLQRAEKGRQVWWQQRQRAQWDLEENSPGELPAPGEWFGRLVGFGKRKK